MEKCMNCTCTGRICFMRLMSLTNEQIMQWCKIHRTELHLSYSQISDATGIPVGTVSRLFSSDSADFKFSTIRPIILLLAGESPDDDFDCQACLHDDAAAEIERLKSENVELHEWLDQAHAHVEANEKNIDFLQSQLKDRRKLITVLCVLLCLATAAIIGALIYDRLNLDTGFFWRSAESLFGRLSDSLNA